MKLARRRPASLTSRDSAFYCALTVTKLRYIERFETMYRDSSTRSSYTVNDRERRRKLVSAMMRSNVSVTPTTSRVKTWILTSRLTRCGYGKRSTRRRWCSMTNVSTRRFRFATRLTYYGFRHPGASSGARARVNFARRVSFGPSERVNIREPIRAVVFLRRERDTRVASDVSGMWKRV